jgi:hypothetical protein
MKTPASEHARARPWLASGWRAVLAVLAWHRQRRAFAPYLGQIVRCLLESPVFVHHTYYTTKVGEKSIGRTLNFA